MALYHKILWFEGKKLDNFVRFMQKIKLAKQCLANFKIINKFPVDKY